MSLKQRKQSKQDRGFQEDIADTDMFPVGMAVIVSLPGGIVTFGLIVQMEATRIIVIRFKAVSQ